MIGGTRVNHRSFAWVCSQALGPAVRRSATAHQTPVCSQALAQGEIKGMTIQWEAHVPFTIWPSWWEPFWGRIMEMWCSRKTQSTRTVSCCQFYALVQSTKAVYSGFLSDEVITEILEVEQAPIFRTFRTWHMLFPAELHTPALSSIALITAPVLNVPFYRLYIIHTFNLLYTPPHFTSICSIFNILYKKLNIFCSPLSIALHIKLTLP